MQASTPSKKAKFVACPNCKAQSEFGPNNPYRPFCSQRCKMIDLGDWASENYKIPEKTPSTKLNDIS